MVVYNKNYDFKAQKFVVSDKGEILSSENLDGTSGELLFRKFELNQSLRIIKLPYDADSDVFDKYVVVEK